MDNELVSILVKGNSCGGMLCLVPRRLYFLPDAPPAAPAAPAAHGCVYPTKGAAPYPTCAP